MLDVVRGIALLGRFFVHFSDNSTDPGGGFGHTYKRTVDLLFSGRFYTMFAILFGVGFVVQLRRAEARGDKFVPRYVRRIPHRNNLMLRSAVSPSRCMIERSLLATGIFRATQDS